MKKFLVLLSWLLIFGSASAQMKVKEGSWKSISAANRGISDGSMGLTNMTDAIIDWPYDADGEDVNGLVIVRFDNMAPADIQTVTPQISLGIVSKVEYKEVDGLLKGFYYIPSGKNIDITLNHQMFGSVKIPSKDIDLHGVYEVEIVNAKTVSISITSEPPGAKVKFNNEEQAQTTPMTIQNVLLGRHNISLTPANPSVAESVGTRIIDVTSSQTAFHFDMYRHRDLTIEAIPPTSHIEVKLNDKTIESGVGSLSLKNLRYDQPYTIEAYNDEGRISEKIVINDDLAPKMIFKVNGSRNVSFTAKQNNSTVYGAQVSVNGRFIGTTPCDPRLDYGDYSVQMSYNGFTRSGNLKVGPKTNSYSLKIPTTKHATFNPFDVDYIQREWGLGFQYIYEFEPRDVADHGVLAGITYQPYFGYGQGLSTGLYYKGIFNSHKANEDEPSVKSGIFVPIQYQFRLPLARNFSVAINAGTGLTFNLHGEGSWESDDFSIKPNRFDCSFLVGVAIQYRSMQFEGKYSKNLIGVDIDNIGEKFKSRMYIAGITFLF